MSSSSSSSLFSSSSSSSSSITPCLFSLALSQASLHPSAKELIDSDNLLETMELAQEANRNHTTSNIKGRVNFDRKGTSPLNDKLNRQEKMNWLTNKLTGQADYHQNEDLSVVVNMNSPVIPEFHVEVQFTEVEWSKALQGKTVHPKSTNQCHVSSLYTKLDFQVQNYILRVDTLQDPMVWIEVDIRKIHKL